MTARQLIARPELAERSATWPRRRPAARSAHSRTCPSVGSSCVRRCRSPTATAVRCRSSGPIRPAGRIASGDGRRHAEIGALIAAVGEQDARPDRERRSGRRRARSCRRRSCRRTPSWPSMPLQQLGAQADGASPARYSDERAGLDRRLDLADRRADVEILALPCDIRGRARTQSRPPTISAMLGAVVRRAERERLGAVARCRRRTAARRSVPSAPTNSG